MSNVVIRVENLAKQYKIGTLQHRPDTLRDHITASVKSMFSRNGQGCSSDSNDTIWALKDVSFEVKHGEVMGFVGHNGAGKSTLLKILSRITEPTAGFAEIRGRVSSLLEVGTGFHPELTGCENIYLSGVILGMTKAEIDRKFDEIVSFAEVEKFIDTPVKRYSSGMYVRLAFAVAAHLETEILLVDEVLAVGDVEFQKKCLGKMDEVAKQGRTVLFVSHSMATVLNLCSRAILLRAGRLVYDGLAEATIKHHLAYHSSKTAQVLEDNPERSGNGVVRLVGARILNEVNQPTSHLIAGRPASFEFRYKNVSGNQRGCNILFAIYNQLGVAVSCFDFSLNHGLVEQLGDSGVFTCHIPNLPLPIGQYYIVVRIEVSQEAADFVPHALVFDVVNSNFFKSGQTPPLRFCACLVDHTWSQQAKLEPDVILAQ